MFNKISTQVDKLVSMSKSKQQPSKTKILVVTSGKGGVGKSTLTSNIAYLLTKKNKKVVVLDADIGLANLQVLFDVKPQYTSHDYIQGLCSLQDILIKTKYNNITLIAGKSGYQYSNQTNSLYFSRLVDDILALNYFDILVIDTGAGLNEYVKEFLDISDNILAITTTDPSALTDVYALLKLVSLKKDKLMLCFNFTAKYETGQTITTSLKKLAIQNRLNKNFMVQYVGNISTNNTIPTANRLRKLFIKELNEDLASLELNVVVNNIIMNME